MLIEVFQHPHQKPLVARIPVGQQSGAGRPSPSLKKAVQRPDKQQQRQGVPEGEQHVQHPGCHQADAHKSPLTLAVVPQSGGKFRQPVAQVKQRPDQADVAFTQPQIHLQSGQHVVEAFARQVKRGVANHHADQQSRAQSAIALSNLFS
jgi:hypothetical protein